MLSARKLISQSKEVLASSRASARLAQYRIALSRKHLSDGGDAVVRSASSIGAARAAMRRR